MVVDATNYKLVNTKRRTDQENSDLEAIAICYYITLSIPCNVRVLRVGGNTVFKSTRVSM